MTELRHRLATRDDLAALTVLMDAAIGELQKPFLNEAEIASSRMIMGLDTQLIDDGTYFVVEQDGALAGCGGWSRRATLYGGDRSPGRDAKLLDPATEPARVRAMYTHPAFTRRGVGRLILSLCEQAASAEGFVRAELMATHGRRAALSRLRLSTDRSAYGRPRRRGGAVAADEQGFGGRSGIGGLTGTYERTSARGCPNLRGRNDQSQSLTRSTTRRPLRQ